MAAEESLIVALPNAGYPAGTGLPTGTWRGIVRVTGDASGNDTARLLFNQTGASRNSNYYSLEQLGLTNGVSNSVGYIINSSNMHGEFAIDDTVGIWRNQQLSDQLAIDLTIPLADMQFPLRWWVGRQNTDLVQAFIQAQAASVLNTVTTFWALGYFWGPGAINAVGGIKYPTSPGMLG